MPSIIQRVLGLGLLLLLALVGSISMRMLNRMPNAIVYFVQHAEEQQHLVNAARRVSGSSLEERLQNSIKALQLGLTAAEQGKAYSNTIPAELSLYQLEQRGNSLRVDISRDFYSLDKDTETARFYQLAYTLTQPAGIDNLELSIEGIPYAGFDNPWQRPEQLPAGW